MGDLRAHHFSPALHPTFSDLEAVVPQLPLPLESPTGHALLYTESLGDFRGPTLLGMKLPSYPRGLEGLCDACRLSTAFAPILSARNSHSRDPHSDSRQTSAQMPPAH